MNVSVTEGLRSAARHQYYNIWEHRGSGTLEAASKTRASYSFGIFSKLYALKNAELQKANHLSKNWLSYLPGSVCHHSSVKICFRRTRTSSQCIENVTTLLDATLYCLLENILAGPRKSLKTLSILSLKFVLTLAQDGAPHGCSWPTPIH